jgi:hypothetical protein
MTCEESEHSRTSAKVQGLEQEGVEMAQEKLEKERRPPPSRASERVSE